MLMVSRANKAVVTCNNCSASFYILHTDIYANGRFVRCSLCEHEWLVKSDDLKALSSKSAMQDDVAALASRRKRNITAIWTISTIIFCVVLYYFDYSNVNHRAVSQLHDISIDRISYDIQDVPNGNLQTSNKSFLLLSMAIKNASNELQHIEKITVIGLDKAKKHMVQVSVSLNEQVQAHAVFNVTVKLPYYKILPLHANIILFMKNNERYQFHETIKIER